jgi:uncharacterized protein (DUF2141 family)
MRILIITSIIFVLFQFTVAQTIENDRNGNLRIVITGLQSDEGEVRLALCDSREEFESNGNYYLHLKLKIKEGIAEHTISDLPYGEYAIKLYHDENSDGELNSNFLGIPTEDYGFSNNVTSTFGPVDYADTKFLFEQPKMTMTISID